MTRDELERLIQRPSERMDTELKQWFDPASAEGIAKIAKACLALRNYNGGCLIVGFDDNGNPDTAAPPADVRKAFHGDAIQAIVSKYASQPFPVTVEFVERSRIEYPAICVPSGVETPVAAKSNLENPDPTKSALIRCDTVYVRSLNSNGIISSSPARCKDWPQIVRTCFDNREADIGAFIRRHLSNTDLGAVLGMVPAKPRLDAAQRAVEFLDVAKARFVSVRNEKGLQIPGGTFEIAVLIDGEFPHLSATQDTLLRLQLNKPRHSGWSFWLGSGMADEHVYVFDNAWESLIVGTPFEPRGFDFWRAETAGRFYHIRALWDDCTKRLPPGEQLDFALHTAHVTEAVSIGAHFAREIGCDEQTTILGFACRWSKLQGRILHSWSDLSRGFVAPAAVEDKKTTSANMPLETSPTAYAPVVESLVAPLFELFGGTRFQSVVIEEIVRNTLARHY